MKSLHARIGLILAGSLWFSVFIPSPGSAQITSTKDGCRVRIVDEMSLVQNEYRAHIFGSRKDRDNKFTVLTGGETNAQYRGIFETKGRLSSELIWPLVESYRVLRCRSTAVCEAAKQSFGVTNQMLNIRPIGCARQQILSYNECSFAGSDNGVPQSDVVGVQQECGVLVGESLKVERSVLKLAVSYDSGYRAALQLGGMINWMQEDFPTKVLKPVRDMINLLGKLHEIPCFIGQCDSPDTSGL